MLSFNVIIVDDHPVVAMALESLLRHHSRVNSISVFSHVETAIKHIVKHEQSRRCIVILDIDMPGVNGLDMLRLLPKGLHRTSPITMIYTGLKALEMEVNALRAGASGFVTKEVGVEGFLRAFESICNGRSFFSDEAVHIALSGFNNPHQQKVARLTPREYLIAKRLANGESPKDIADSLFISTKTVSAHKSNLLDKLEIDNIAQLINIFQDMH
ncbi:two-component system response regulator EvgA [Herbaspirillum rubrisubalbicans]|uniref:response regulator n=1 Tax=Herbaspirillum rubrisubalbicans TaxID=80842 RepID=UPI0020A1494A|nr:response regulator transcription factor [Herbaspirillum rubrisubalbicans]MCP1573289.1 two-component system response regulator EvgA [Herbaspirillum rubrisubalbicans]